MAAQPEGSRVVVSPNALGALLLSRGLITEEQLTAALREQHRSGARLGTILVELGFASPALIAQALATQHGATLKTEYGFATGFGSIVPPDSRIESPLLSPQPPPTMLGGIDPPPVSPAFDRSEPSVETDVASSSPPLFEANSPHQGERSELEPQLVEEAQHIAGLGLKLELAEVRAVSVGSDAATFETENVTPRESLSQRQAAYAERERDVEQVGAQLVPLQARLAAAEQERVQLVESAAVRRVELERELTQAAEQVALLRNEMAKRDTALAELNTSTAERDAKHDELVRSLAAEVDRGKLLSAKLVEAVEQLGSLRQELAERNIAPAEKRVAKPVSHRSRVPLERALTAEMDRTRSLKSELVATEQRRLHLAASLETNRAELKHQLAQVEALTLELSIQIVISERFIASGSANQEARQMLERRVCVARAQRRAAEESQETLRERLAQTSGMSDALDAVSAETDALRRSILASEQSALDLEQQLSAVIRVPEQRDAGGTAAHIGLEAEPWSGAHAHLIFFQSADGYQIVQREGSPPAKGSTVETPAGQRQIVVRITGSLYPGTTLPCAYLIPN